MMTRGSARELDTLLASLFREEQIYRIPTTTFAKEMLQGIMNFRFTNNLFEAEVDAQARREASTSRFSRRSARRSAARSTTPWALCATWGRTTCCRCSRWWRWTSPHPPPRTTSARPAPT